MCLDGKRRKVSVVVTVDICLTLGAGTDDGMVIGRVYVGYGAVSSVFPRVGDCAPSPSGCSERTIGRIVS